MNNGLAGSLNHSRTMLTLAGNTDDEQGHGRQRAEAASLRRQQQRAGRHFAYPGGVGVEARGAGQFGGNDVVERLAVRQSAGRPCRPDMAPIRWAGFWLAICCSSGGDEVMVTYVQVRRRRSDDGYPWLRADCGVGSAGSTRRWLIGRSTP